MQKMYYREILSLTEVFERPAYPFYLSKQLIPTLPICLITTVTTVILLFILIQVKAIIPYILILPNINRIGGLLTMSSYTD